MIFEHGETWGNIPADMKALNQWCLAGTNKAPLMVGSSGTTYNASPIAGPWMSFQEACAHAMRLELGIGFVITPNDPFTCIDFDIKDGQSFDGFGNHIQRSKFTQPFMLDRYLAIKDSFDSYTELSQSLKGMHVWVRGKVPKGVKRDGVELYSQDRFMVCTGISVSKVYYSVFADIVLACAPALEIKPIAERQELLNRLYDEMSVAGGADAEDNDPLIEVEPTESDAAIWQRAASADNREKFLQLCEGRWQGIGYPTQSEADLSLMSMFAFYTKSFEQMRRMFRQTALGQREKAQKDNRYLDLTLKLIRNRIRRDEERQKRQVENSTLEVQRLVQQMQIEKVQGITAQAIEAVSLPVSRGNGINWPPGMAGALAGFIYQSAMRPVKEVAVVAALGLLAGFVGKAYNIPQSGLNLYITLVARSAIGKEAMHSGIGLIVEKLRNSIPGIEKFVDFGEMASGQALTKACAESPSFVNINGEWGKTLRSLSNEGTKSGPAESLRKVMTNLYQKSGASSIVGGIRYSNKDSNIGSMNGVAYSMIGESTPKVFYEALTDTMMEDGFLSRFTIIEYDGDRPPENENPITQLDDRLYSALCSLLVQCMTLIQHSKTVMVQYDQQAWFKLKEFNLRCDNEINSTDDERWRQMWNRAHLKVLRIAAVLAVADNFVNPVVNISYVEWALDVVLRDIEVMSRKLKEGDVGQGDGVRERKLISVIKTFFTAKLPDSYRIPPELVQQGIVPRKFLQTRTATLTQFTGHRLGATIALDQTLKSLIDSGYIMEVDKTVLSQEFNFHGRCFRVVNLS